jgi:hypothetical protein
VAERTREGRLSRRGQATEDAECQLPRPLATRSSGVPGGLHAAGVEAAGGRGGLPDTPSARRACAESQRSDAPPGGAEDEQARFKVQERMLGPGRLRGPLNLRLQLWVWQVLYAGESSAPRFQPPEHF